MKRVLLVISLLLIVTLSVVFNKYDLDISIFLTKHGGYFFEFFDDFGELPIYFGPIIFGGVYFCLSKKNIYKFLAALVSFIAYLIASIKVIGNLDYSLNLTRVLFGVVISLVLTLITLYVFSKINKDVLDKIKDLALLGLVVSVVSFGCVQLLKNTWGRVRFRDLSDDYSEFTSLFTINGLTGHHSFPSGHTNAGTSILLIALLVPRFSDKKWLKYLITGLCFVYIAALAVARIVVRAHYASDVLFGFLVGFTTLCVTYSILRRKGVINASNNKC